MDISRKFGLERAGLLLYYIQHHNDGMSNVQIAHVLGKKEWWVRKNIALFCQIYGLTNTKMNKINEVLNAELNAEGNAEANAELKHNITISKSSAYKDEKSANAEGNAEGNAEQNAENKTDDIKEMNAKVFEQLWKDYGCIGNKQIAKRRFLKLSNVKKKQLIDSVPYYKAFHDPSYYQHLSTYINEETWNSIETYEGESIPKDKYRIADADRFIEWFNRNVQNTGIPQISKLTPARYRMLNICYTLCKDEMLRVMNILLTDKKYIEMADKKMIDFDYIFKPSNLRKICEKGGDE